MKQLMMILAVAATSLFSTANAADVNQKVLKSFKNTFNCVESVNWSQFGNYYIAQFEEGKVKSNAVYNNEGELVKVVRSYKENLLLPMVLKTIKENFKDVTINTIDEVTEGNELYFEMSFYDNDYYYFVKTTIDGKIYLQNQYERGV